ncbi:unnamed protein product [Amaranthus hypochondriacus]
MEFPVINRMTDSLTNPSLISRVFSTFELGKLSHAHRLWKWGALFLALLYTLSSLVNKIKLLMLFYHNKSKALLAKSEPFFSHFDDVFLTDDDENDAVCSVSGSSSDDEEEDDEDEIISQDFSRFFEDDFNVKGSFRNFSLSDLVNGSSVVKLWDGLDLGILEVHDAFSFLDFNNYENSNCISSSIFCGIPAVSSSPAVLISGHEKSGMNIWDLRAGGKSPAVHSEWKSENCGNVIRVDSGRTGKVYVRDDVSRCLTVGDVRRVKSPLAEYDESTHQ